MNALFENAKANHLIHEAWMAEHNDALKREREKIIAENNSYDDLRTRREKINEVFGEYKLFVENTLLGAVIESFMEEALNESNMDNIDKNMQHTLVQQYIKENGGAMHILIKNSNKTILLDTIKEAVEDATEEIVAKADKDDPTTLVIDKKDIEKFLDKLNDENDFGEVKSVIAARVSSAENSFLNDNRAEKEAMKDIIQQTQERIDAVNNDERMSDSAKEAITQEATMISKRKMTAIREGKRRTIFDEMVHKFSKSCMTKDGLAKNYITETGKLNTARVVNTVRTMYTLMETLQTVKLETISDAYIDDVLANL